MKRVIISLILVVVVSVALLGFAEEVKRTAKVSYVEGMAEVRSLGEKEWNPVKVGIILNEKDIVRTSTGSWLLINLNGDEKTATVEVSEGSQLMIAELVKDEEKGTQKTLLDLAIGEILIKAQKIDSAESKFEVKTQHLL